MVRRGFDTTADQQRNVLCLIGCGKAKLSRTLVGLRGGSVAARDLYVGGLFATCRKWAERNCKDVLILSAKYGPIPLDYRAKWYDLHVDDLDEVHRAAWSVAASTLVTSWAQGRRVVCLAGESYSRLLTTPVIPLLKGLGQGRRMEWLKLHPTLTDAMLEGRIP